jgi:CBS domain-containing protein
MTIASILESKGGEVISVTATEPVRRAVELLAEKRIGALPVMEDGQVVGIFSERDLLYGLASDGAAMLDRRIGDVMTAPPITVESGLPILTALSLMTRRRVRHLPVVDGGSMIGFVSIGDLVKKRIDRIEEEAEAMRSYIQGS